MSLKSISIVLFGLALCCFLQGTAAAQEDSSCLLKLDYGPSIPDFYVWIWSEGGKYATPFAGWQEFNGINVTSTVTTLGRITKASPYCDYCTMTVFTKDDFTRDPQTIDFRTRVGDNSEISLKYYSKSFILECFPPEDQEETWEPEEQEEFQEEIEVEAPEEEEVEEEEQEEIEYIDPVFQPMNEGDGETLPFWLVDWRHKTVDFAIKALVSKNVLPAGKYTTERVYSTEISTNFDNFYRFNVQIRDESGVEYRIWWTTPAGHEIYVYEVIDSGVKENRSAEFPNTDFKVLPIVEESQAPYPAEVESLGTRSVNQAVVKLQAKSILPQGNVGFYALNLIEYSSIVNMTEYSDHDDILYRFNARVIDQSGAIFRVWTVVATNYETPEYYELIDFGYKQSRLEDFTETDWQEFNQGEPLPPGSDFEKMRDASVAQVIPRLQAEGTIPAGNYSIANTYATEFSFGFENPNWPYFTSQPTDGLYRFNVQVSNEAGARYRVTVVIATNYDIQPKYELVDYSLVENRIDEFTNIKFISLDQDDLRTKTLNQAVDRLVAKKTLPEGQYTIAQVYPTSFSSQFEHPYYSTDEDILYNFTAQVKNTAGTGFKIYAIVITDYADPTDYELIDYGKLNA